MDIRSLLGYLGQIQLDREYRLKYYWFWLAPSTTKAWGGRTPEWRWCIIEARHGSCIGHEGAKDFWENYGWSFYHGCSGIHWLYMRGWSKLERCPSVPCFFTFDSHWVPLRDSSVSSKLSLEIGSVLEIFMDSLESWQRWEVFGSLWPPVSIPMTPKVRPTRTWLGHVLSAFVNALWLQSPSPKSLEHFWV